MTAKRKGERPRTAGGAIGRQAGTSKTRAKHASRHGVKGEISLFAGEIHPNQCDCIRSLRPHIGTRGDVVRSSFFPIGPVLNFLRAWKQSLVGSLVGLLLGLLLGLQASSTHAHALTGTAL